MNKLLRYSLVAIMAIIGMGNAMAQEPEVTLDFSTNDEFSLPTDYVKTEASYTGKTSGVTLTFGASNNGHKINTKDGYLIFGKKDATLTIGTFSYAVERIDIVGRTGASGAVEQNIFVGDDAVSTKTTGATSTNLYEIAEASQSAGSFTLKVLSAHNTQITKILIWKKGSGTKKAAGLSWGTNSRTVTLGADDNVFPTLTNDNGLTVTFDSSDKSVATINEAGEVTLVAAGKTDISAIFAGNDEYEAQTVTYALTVKATPKAVTVAEALTIIAELEDGATTTDDYIVSGYVVGELDFQRNTKGELYGNVNFTMANEEGGTNLLTVYRAKNIGNVNFEEETINKFQENDKVVIFGQLQKFIKDEVTTPEIKNCYIMSIATDVAITPESGDIATALSDALGEFEAKNVTISLAKNGKYTVSKSIEATGAVIINGAEGAEIDASALEEPVIKMKEETLPSWVDIGEVKVNDVKIKGLKSALFYSATKNYAMDLTIDNTIIEVAADVTVIDFTKGSTAKTITFMNNTVYAPTATTKQFYSSQAGQKTTEYDAEAVQTFKFHNNTMYNLVKAKNFFSHRQSNQKWLAYDVKNNLFVNCGKTGQVIKGMNGGQGGANPTWTIDGNAFNFDDADTSANEETGDADEAVKNSVAGVVTFTDAANGDFNGTFKLATGATEPASLGDPRWTLTYSAADGIFNVKAADAVNAPIFNMAGQRVNDTFKGVVIQNGKKFVNK